MDVIVNRYGGRYELEMIILDPNLKRSTVFADNEIKGHLWLYEDSAYTKKDDEFGPGEQADTNMYVKFLVRIIDNLKRKGKLK